MKHTKVNRNGKDNKFFVVIYPDSTTYTLEEFKINLATLAVKYASILHDKDVDEDGVIKKPHIHVFFKTENQMSIASVAAKLAIPQNAIEFAVSERGCIRYLLHLDNAEKAQYTQDLIETDYDISKLLVDKEVDDFKRMSELYAYIKSAQVHTFQDLLDYCLINNRADLLKFVINKSYFFRQLLNEMH